MALREFEDRAGVHWRVWDVHPGARRPEVTRADAPPEKERRAESLFSERVRRQFASGWLAFEREGERRRLSPIPPHWETLSDEQLRELCDRAKPFTARLSVDFDVELGI